MEKSITKLNRELSILDRIAKDEKLANKDKYYSVLGKLLRDDIYEELRSGSYKEKTDKHDAFYKNKMENILSRISKGDDSFELEEDEIIISEEDLIKLLEYNDYINRPKVMDQIGILVSFYERAFNETNNFYYLIKIAKLYFHIDYYETSKKMLELYLSYGVLYSVEVYKLLKQCDNRISNMKINFYSNSISEGIEKYIPINEQQIDSLIDRKTVDREEEKNNIVATKNKNINILNRKLKEVRIFLEAKNINSEFPIQKRKI